MNRVFILHYHEIWLKGGNKNYFLSRLIAAVKHALADLPVAGPQFTSERLLLYPRTEEAAPEIIARLRRIFGLAYVAAAVEVASEPAAIGAAACEMMMEKNPRTFAVRAKIADSEFPLNSMELERAVGRQILDHLHAEGREVKVKLNAPEVTCWVEVIPGHTFLYADRVEGA
jgi:thiamine biosynthesis protein ThiI